jgi:PST family polysaccharide transporter
MSETQGLYTETREHDFDDRPTVRIHLWEHELSPWEPRRRNPEVEGRVVVPQTRMAGSRESGRRRRRGAADEPELGTKVKRAVRWSLLNTIIIRVGTFVTGIILARGLLTPLDWGLYATGMVALSVLLSANEMGVSLALIRWTRDVREFAPTVLTLSAGFSVLLYAALFVGAKPVANILGSPEAENVLRVLCLSVVIDGIACVPASVLTREFAQGKRLFIDFANFAVGTGVTLVMAYRGDGAMSFAWGGVAGNAVALVGVAIAAPGFLKPGWDWEQAKELLRFGAPLAGASLFVLAMLSTDSAVIGVMLGPVSLGLYRIAFNMSSWPVRTISEATRRVSFAGFSRAGETAQEMAAGFNKGLSPLLLAAVLPCALLGALPEPVVQTVYGREWDAAAQALRFLAVLGLLRIMFELCYDFLVAAGKRRTLLVVQGWWLAALIPALIIGAKVDDISGVGAGHCIVAGVLVSPAFLVALRSAGVPLAGVFRTMARPALGGVVVVVVSLTVHKALGDSFLSLAAAGLAATAAYAVTAVPPALLKRLAGAVRSRRLSEAPA